MAELSPVAQAVLNAFRAVPDLRDCPSIAAALRAAVDQVVPETMKPDDTLCCPPIDTIVWKRLMNVRQQFLAISDELENHQ